MSDGSALPLRGLQVVDLCTAAAGSIAGMLLGDLGADVVRVEGADGTHLRPAPTEFADPVCWDRSKRREVVPALEPGDAALAALIADADVILVDDDTGALGAVRPDTIIGRFPPFGHEPGTFAGLPADPLLVSAVSGFADFQPTVRGVPIAPVVRIIESIQGATGAAAVMAGLIHRGRGGGGQVVTVSGLHATAVLQASVMTDAPDQAVVYGAGRDARARPNFRAYRCADGEWVFLAALVGPLFIAALDALDAFEVMLIEGVDGEFLHLQAPELGRQAVALLEPKFAARPSAHWLRVFAEVDVPVALVSDRASWLASDAFAAACGLRAFDRPDVGRVTTPNCPVRVMSRAAQGGALPVATPGAAPLAGLRVLDLSTYLAGPFTSSLLAQWGADVIKVETPAGDPYRVFTIPHAAVNNAKRSLVVDLKSADGRALFDRMLAGADVLVDNLRPSARAGLGLGSDALFATNPALVHANLTAFGPVGTAAERPGFDPVIQALSGLMQATGGAADPINTATPVHDVAAAALTALGVLAAVWQRTSSGAGAQVITSLAAASALLQCAEFTAYADRPRAASGSADHLGEAPWHRYCATADGWVAIAATTAAEQAATRRVMGDDPEAFAAVHSTADAVGLLRAAGVPAARVLLHDDWATDAHMVANGFARILRDPDVGRCLVVGSYAEWSRSAKVLSDELCRRGAHTAEITKELW